MAEWLHFVNNSSNQLSLAQQCEAAFNASMQTETGTETEKGTETETETTGDTNNCRPLK